MPPRTLFQKVWDAHVVRPATADTPAVLYVDLHLIHEVTSPQAFTVLRERGLRVRRPERTVATMDHSTPTTPRGADGRIHIADGQAAAQVAALEQSCRDFGITLYPLGSERQGIVHVIGPELGLTQPGKDKWRRHRFEPSAASGRLTASPRTPPSRSVGSRGPTCRPLNRSSPS